MPNPTSDIILHNYPQSPVAEKVRVVLGMKKLNWYSVEIPRIPPKPLLTILTGGYRRTPVMQIGADIYCDSLCIINEIDRRYPAPAMYPDADAGLAWCLGRWADGDLFAMSIKVILGSAGDALAPEFAEDRGRLYFGPDWAEELQQAGATIPHLAAQIGAGFHQLNRQLSDGRKFIMGDAPSAIDAQLYHVVWFLRGRWNKGPDFLSGFPELVSWETHVNEIGHGNQTEMSAEKAIDLATNSNPISASGVTKNEPQNFRVGTVVQVVPDVDGGEQPVDGTVVFADSQSITIARHDPEIGDIHVHYPRAGYEIKLS